MQKYIDTRLPLTWLLSCTITLVVTIVGSLMAMTGQYHDLTNKIDGLVSSNAEQKTKDTLIDSRFDTIRDTLGIVQQQLAVHSSQLDALNNLQQRRSDINDQRITNLERQAKTSKHSDVEVQHADSLAMEMRQFPIPNNNVTEKH